MPCETCDSCFDVAIKTECQMRDFYIEMVSRFYREKVVADLLKELALDEQAHLNALTVAKAKGNHSDAVHAEAEDFRKQLEGIVASAKKELLEYDHNFDEVYDFIQQQENTEINLIFNYLMTETLGLRGKERQLVLTATQKHIDKINDFTNKLPPEKRVLIKPTPI